MLRVHGSSPLLLVPASAPESLHVNLYLISSHRGGPTRGSTRARPASTSANSQLGEVLGCRSWFPARPSSCSQVLTWRIKSGTDGARSSGTHKPADGILHCQAGPLLISLLTCMCRRSAGAVTVPVNECRAAVLLDPYHVQAHQDTPHTERQKANTKQQQPRLVFTNGPFASMCSPYTVVNRTPAKHAAGRRHDNPTATFSISASMRFEVVCEAQCHKLSQWGRPASAGAGSVPSGDRCKGWDGFNRVSHKLNCNITVAVSNWGF